MINCRICTRSMATAGRPVGQDALHPDAPALDIGIEKREEFVDDAIDAGGLKYIESRCLTYIGPRCIVRP